MGRLLLVWRLAVRDLRRHPVEAIMVFLVIAATATTLTVALALSGVTNSPYRRTRQVTSGPDVVAAYPAQLPTTLSGTAPKLASLASLSRAAGVVAHSGPYPAVYSSVSYRGNTVDVIAEGRDQALASVDQPKVTQGVWVRPGGVVIERGFADALGVHVGDSVAIGGRSLQVVGIGVTAAIPAYPSSLCHVTCPFQLRASLASGRGVPNMGFVWLTRPAVTGLANAGAPLAYLLNLKLANPARAVAFAAQHPFTFTSQSVQGAISALIGIEQVALGVGGWLIGLLALAGLAVLVGRRMTEQTKRVGLLKAVGASSMTVATVLLVEQLTLAVGAAAAGLVAGSLIAPPLASTGAGLLGSPGAPAIGVSTVLIIAVIALAVATISSVVPALRATRNSTVSALADTPRVPTRRPRLIAVSARLPVPFLLGLRQLARRPRRALLIAVSVTVTVTGVVAILASDAHNPIADLTITNLKVDRFRELTTIVTAMLVILAAINTTFIAWATAADGRFSSALERALGATPGQVTAGLSLAALLPALPAAIVGIPLGIGLYHLLASGTQLSAPPTWQLLGVVLATLLSVTALTAIPSRHSARRSPAQILQTE